jgi:hypothetical protein
MRAPADLEVITPSYAPDFELCADLNASVLAHGAGVQHTIIVPPRDLVLFEALVGRDTVVRSAEDFLPGLPRLPRNFRLNPRRPWLPVRGWIAQQVVKLAAAAASDADLVLMVDSDIVFVRPFGAETFLSAEGQPEFYRLEAAVDERLPRHVLWHEAAHRLLGLGPPPPTPLPDYVSCPCVWEPAAVRALLERVEQVASAPWQRVVAAEPHVSEMMLYGVFVDASTDASTDVSPVRHVVDDMRCHRHYDEVALDEAELHRFLAGIRPVDHSVMISAKSGTDLEKRRAALRVLV